MVSDAPFLIIRKFLVVNNAVERIEVPDKGRVVGNFGALPGGRGVPAALKQAQRLGEDVVGDVVKAADGLCPELPLDTHNVLPGHQRRFAVRGVGDIPHVPVVVPADTAVHAVGKQAEGAALVHQAAPVVPPLQLGVVVGKVQIGIGGR